METDERPCPGPSYQRAECPVCHFDYALTSEGLVGRHNGVDAAGFSTGRRCNGVGRLPFVPAGA
ncbi:hypothetical protein ABZX75_17285 [Streptomyces sp. NPDC003038]|uniref:hypothetical protein n=1 Tax=unclassified Streptomyces TaxID=2593676 RepID=UPI0033A9A477